MPDEPVLWEQHDAIAVLTLNRPERLNAWNAALEERLFELLDRARRSHSVRVIVITGAGRGFCAGADSEALAEVDPEAPVKVGGAREPMELLSLPKLVIAAINGGCAGVGFSLAAMCDLRFAAAKAKLTTAFARLGLVAENGLSWRLPRLLGPAAALDLLASGRVIVAEEAFQLRFVSRVVPGPSLLAETLAYARDVAESCSPSSVATIKWQVNRHFEAGAQQALAESLELTDTALRSRDFQQGLEAFRGRRPPAFGDLDDDGLRDPFAT